MKRYYNQVIIFLGNLRHKIIPSLKGWKTTYHNNNSLLSGGNNAT